LIRNRPNGDGSIREGIDPVLRDLWQAQRMLSRLSPWDSHRETVSPMLPCPGSRSKVFAGLMRIPDVSRSRSAGRESSSPENLKWKRGFDM
jgi:hypothetical protein